jgi:hypothetical protein
MCITYRHYLRARGEYFLLLRHIKETEALRARPTSLLASGALVKKLKVHVRIKVACEIWAEGERRLAFCCVALGHRQPPPPPAFIFFARLLVAF